MLKPHGAIAERLAQRQEGSRLKRPERALAVRLIDQRRPTRGKAAIAGHRQGPTLALIEVAELGAGAHEQGPARRRPAAG